MKNHEMEAKIKKAYMHDTPDVLASVLSDCQAQKGRVVVMENTRKKNRWIKCTAAVAAVFMLVAGGLFGYQVYNANYAVASTVSLDVNPSIEVEINQKEKVLAVKALNADAENVIGNMDFAGSDLDVVINALIGSMLRNGYLDDIANSILVSVDNADPEKGALLQTKLTNEINTLLKTDQFEGAVLSQIVSVDNALKELADQYGITLGKAQLIQKITAQNTFYTFDSLVSLSINELNLLIGSGKIDDVATTGTASDKAYIGIDKAKEAALAHAGVALADAMNFEIDLDYENGKLVYEMEFDTASYEYKYDIDALTGDVVYSEKEEERSKKLESAAEAVSYIGEAKAKETALAHAGVSESEISGYRAELDTDRGIVVYDIDFYAGDTNYDYEINAQSGEVVKCEKEVYRAAPAQSTASQEYIGEAKAKEAALAHAGVTEADITNYRVELDRDDGRTVYDIDFRDAQAKYDYEINALTGEVVKSEKERYTTVKPSQSAAAVSSPAPAATASAASSPTASASAQTYIGEAKAKATALAHAGVSESDIRDYQIELERDNGVMKYEIEFEIGRMEYDYEINAVTGVIMRSEKDIDD